MAGQILEREEELAALAAAARDAAAGSGSVALIFGEAGIGKSSVVEAVREVLPAAARLLVGCCDDLGTRRTLGPLRDLMDAVGDGLVRALDDAGNRGRVLDELRAELLHPGRPTVLAIEDVHWADEATLDVLQFLVRRVSRMPVLLILTYRDDEVGHDHPLQQLLGHASGTGRAHRLPLARLSREAVVTLGAASPLDPGEVYEVTGGNPFFVTEVLSSGDVGQVPPRVMDAVLARVRGLDRPTQDILDQLAVIPSALDGWLVDELVPGGVAGLEDAERRGVLVVSPIRVAFRHELIRRTIADSLPVAQRVRLNRRVLAALVGHEGSDLSRIVHHAAEAGAGDAILRYGPDAARDAADAGAHREAAAHLRLVLGQPHQFAPADRADLLERYAVECCTVGAARIAVAAQTETVELRRVLGEPVPLAAGLRWLSRMCWLAGDRPGAERAGRDAVAALRGVDDRRSLALALSNNAQLAMLASRDLEAIDVGQRAVALAREVNDPATLSHALNNVGISRWRRGAPDGRHMVEESLAVALAAGQVEHACRAYVNIAWQLLQDVCLEEAGGYLTACIELAERSDFMNLLKYSIMMQGSIAAARGAWDDAIAMVGPGYQTHPPAHCLALTVLARVAVRRGDPGAPVALARATSLATELQELQRTAPVAAIRAEAAWLAGDAPAIPPIVESAYQEARRLDATLHEAELGFWLTRAGRPVPPVDSPHPFALQAAGRWREAARRWRDAGCPYEAALAMADSPDPADLLSALTELERLRAEPLARLVRARLRELGVARMPRGPVAATRDNPAGLTGRQLEVLRLLCAGMTNAMIAKRLVLSVRTVDTHVAAAFSKLGVKTRQEATARAAGLGLLSSREERAALADRNLPVA